MITIEKAVDIIKKESPFLTYFTIAVDRGDTYDITGKASNVMFADDGLCFTVDKESGEILNCGKGIAPFKKEQATPIDLTQEEFDELL